MTNRHESQAAESTLATSWRLEPDPCVVSTIHGDETVLLNAATGRYFTLNAIGGEVWAAVCDRVVLADVIGQLRTKYESHADRVEIDVLTLANQLLAASLVHQVS